MFDDIEGLCVPALIYLIYGTTRVIMDTYKGLFNLAMMQIFITILFTYLLNVLCRGGLGIISWIIVAIPFLLMSVIAVVLLGAFGLDPVTGKAVYTPQAPNQNKQPNMQPNKQPNIQLPSNQLSNQPTNTSSNTGSYQPSNTSSNTGSYQPSNTSNNTGSNQPSNTSSNTGSHQPSNTSSNTSNNTVSNQASNQWYNNSSTYDYDY